MSNAILTNPIKVLVIDDNIEFGIGVKMLLAKEGVEVFTSADGLEGLEMVKHLLPDIVLLDVVMPGMDGIEVCKRIRQTPELIGVYIVMLSGLKTQTDHMSEGLEAGADGYLARPIPNRELLARLRGYLRLKRTEKALEITEEKYRRIAENATDVVWVTDLEMNPTYISPSVERVFGIKPEEYLKLPLNKTYPPATLKKFQKKLTEELFKEQDPEVDKNRIFQLEVERYSADGTIAWDAIKATFVRDKQMNPVAIQGVSQDITERKKVKEDLQRIEWMLSKKATTVKKDPTPLYGDLSELNSNRLILDSVGKNVLEEIANDSLRLLESSSAIYEKNGDYALGIFASGWCRFMDQASRELCVTDDNKEALNCGKWLCHESCWKEASQKAMESRNPVEIECHGGINLYALPIVAGDEIIGAINFGYGDPPQDKEKLCELAEKYKVPLDELVKKAQEYESRPAFIIETAKERLQASANLIGEIVSRKIMEKKIITLNEELEHRVIERTAELEASNKELEAFSYTVAHDLRAPLRHINGYVNLLSEIYHTDLPEKAQYYLKTVKDSARQMGVLIDELLHFSRTGRQELRKTKIEMNALVKEVVEVIKHNIGKREIIWKVQELPQVIGDYSMLKQVWFNLLDNAVKYTRNTQNAEISISSKEEDKNIVFFVRDNGVGFDMRYAHKLFGVFQRLHSHAEFEGTGIGLANVQRIIHKHNGQVWTEAEPGKGATFFFSLQMDK
jgi:PAS domain S-box-containing protein